MKNLMKKLLSILMIIIILFTLSPKVIAADPIMVITPAEEIIRGSDILFGTYYSEEWSNRVTLYNGVEEKNLSKNTDYINIDVSATNKQIKLLGVYTNKLFPGNYTIRQYQDNDLKAEGSFQLLPKNIYDTNIQTTPTNLYKGCPFNIETHIPSEDFIEIRLGTEILIKDTHYNLREQDTVSIDLNMEYTENILTGNYNIYIKGIDGEIFKTVNVCPMIDYSNFTDIITQTPRIGEDLEVETLIDGPINLIKLNDVELDSIYYEINGTKITIKSEYTKTLDAGTYVLYLKGTKGFSENNIIFARAEYTAIYSPERPIIGDDIIFTTNIPYNKFSEIKINDDILLTTNYEKEKIGENTKIIIKSDYTKDLIAGKYEVKLIAINGDNESEIILLAPEYTTSIPKEPELGEVISFITDIPFGKFKEIQIGNKVVNKNDYILENVNGKTKIILKEKYTEGLSIERHNVIIRTLDGGEINEEFIVNSIEYNIIQKPKEPKKGQDLIFKSDAPFDKFVRFEINGIEVDPKYYEVTEGSTVVKLYKNFINDNLKIGENYKVTIVSLQGSASTTFKLEKTVVNNPSTGDNILSVNLALIILIVAFIVVKKIQKIQKYNIR